MPVARLRSRTLAVGALALASVSAGCNNAGQGALSGAAVGTLAGLSIGSLSGNAGPGAIIGLVSGAVAGGIIGDQNMRADLRAGGATTDGRGGWGDDKLPPASAPVTYHDPYSPHALRAQYGDPGPAQDRYGPSPAPVDAPPREQQVYGPTAPGPAGSRVVASGTVPATAAIARAGVRAEYAHQALLKRYGEGDLESAAAYDPALTFDPRYASSGNVDLHTARGSYIGHDCHDRCDHIYCSRCDGYHDRLRYSTVCWPSWRYGLGYSYSSDYGSSIGFSIGWWDWYDWDYRCRYGYTAYRPSSHWRYTYRPYSWWGWSSGWGYGWRDYRWCDSYSPSYGYWYSGSLHGGYYGGSSKKHHKGDSYYTDKYGYDWVGAQGGLAPGLSSPALATSEGPKIQNPALMDSRRGDAARERSRSSRAQSSARAEATQRPSRSEARQETADRPSRAERPARSTRREMIPEPSSRAGDRATAPARAERPTRTTRRQMMPEPATRGSRPAAAPSRAPARATRPAAAPSRQSAPSRGSSRGGGRSVGNNPAMMPSRRGGGRGG